jgi:hypothetical protein|tara:strand:- start:130 stop:306 length:177 start_codon:yes stop_codon:yes gene_type:complete
VVRHHRRGVRFPSPTPRSLAEDPACTNAAVLLSAVGDGVDVSGDGSYQRRGAFGSSTP